MLCGRVNLRLIGKRHPHRFAARIRFVGFDLSPLRAALGVVERQNPHRKAFLNNPADGKQSRIRSHYGIVAQAKENVPALARHLAAD